MDSNGRPLGAQTIILPNTIATSREILNNGRTTMGSADIPVYSSIATQSTTVNNTTPTQNGIEYLYLGVGIATVGILAVIVCLIALLLIRCVLRRVKPTDSIEVPSPEVQEQKGRDPRLFDKIETEDKVVYMRTAEGIKQFPDLYSEPIYELVDIVMEVKPPGVPVSADDVNTPIYQEIS